MKLIIKKSSRKTMSLTVDDNLNALIYAPYFVSENDIIEFYNSHKDWIASACERKIKYLKLYDKTDNEIKELKSLAREYLPERIDYYSKIMGVYPSGLKITSAKKRFGSCNGKNSICLSFYLMLFPEEAVDYVVVHELAHIKHHNHGKEFYKLVESILPDFKEREKLLKIN